MAYGKIILIFGVFFPLEMFPGIIQTIIRYSPIYGVASGPAKLALHFSPNLYLEVLITQIIIILVIGLLIVYFTKVDITDIFMFLLGRK